eukprot:gb/GEZN01004802.1/.p1 GENE.gb/GEZN01004802.1/~~gb/GEZN01004802.1/.p1  ORF type:complete len:544 (+),score=59.50 gb/GEZN01004802.1/:62-1693(+)
MARRFRIRDVFCLAIVSFATWFTMSQCLLTCEAAVALQPHNQMQQEEPYRQQPQRENETQQQHRQSEKQRELRRQRHQKQNQTRQHQRELRRQRHPRQNPTQQQHQPLPPQEQQAALKLNSNTLVNTVPRLTSDNPLVRQTTFTVASYETKFGRKPPQKFDAFLRFAQQRKCLNSIEAYAQIYQDLYPFFEKGNITDSELPQWADYFLVFDGRKFSGGTIQGENAMLKEVEQLMPAFPFKIGNNRWDEPRSLRSTDGSLAPYRNTNDLIRRNKCMNETYGQQVNLHGFLLRPSSFVTQNQLVAVLSQCRTYCHHDILWPKPAEHLGLPQEMPWEQRLAVFFWRGSTTGGKYDSNAAWRQFQRTRLLVWAKDYLRRHPDAKFDASVDKVPRSKTELVIDVGLHHILQCDFTVCDTLQREFGTRPRVEFEETRHFKYLLVIDGNSWANRLLRYLASGSVVLLVTIFADWMASLLTPMVHYVPVKLDLSDLEEKLEWLYTHDAEAKQIAQNALALAGRLDLDQMACYSGLLLIEYADLYRKGHSGS